MSMLDFTGSTEILTVKMEGRETGERTEVEVNRLYASHIRLHRLQSVAHIAFSTQASSLEL